MSNLTIVCPSCNYTKEVPGERIPQGGARVTCPRCKEGFPLSAGRRPVPTTTQQTPRGTYGVVFDI